MVRSCLLSMAATARSTAFSTWARAMVAQAASTGSRSSTDTSRPISRQNCSSFRSASALACLAFSCVS